MTTLTLSLKNITKRYHMGDTEVQALAGVDLEVERGAFVAVRGPSGSGKSTLLNICGLVDGFDTGEYRLAGENVAGLDERARTLLRRRSIGFIFQSYNLGPVLTVAENVGYPLQLLGLSEAEGRRRVVAMLEQVGLTGMADRHPEQLSGGQRQRVAIARALVKEPSLVIADEPTANLDSATATRIVDLMRKLGGQLQTTFLIATHDDRMSAHCDRTCSLRDGLWEADDAVAGQS